MTRPGVTEVLRKLPEADAAVTRSVIEAADAVGASLLLVGGPVRDLLLERPVRDVDLLVEGKDGEGAEDLAERLAGPTLRVVAHGRFGTVRLEAEGATLDLATTRTETYAYDGALPSVAPGTLAEDLQRRDFAINALALPLSRRARERHTGVVDVAGGLADLERKRLRVLHERSFHDDPTRALRAARLGPRLGFTLARSSRSALRSALRDGAFGHVSGDRLRREIVKLFDDAELGLDPARALRLLADWHVLGMLEPGLTLPREAIAPLRRLGRAVAAPPWRAPRWRPWTSGLALWLAPLSPQLRRRTLRRFALRGALAKRLAEAPRQRERLLRVLARKRGRGAVDAALSGLPEEELHALYAWAGPAERRRIVRYAADDRGRRPPVSGSDLTEIGLAGPAVGRALERIRAGFLDGTVRTRDEALALAREVGRRRGRNR